MSEKKFRIYIILLTDIKSAEADQSFGIIVRDKKFDWWRNTPLNWILITPITVSTNEIIADVTKAYGGEYFFCVLEIDINDFGGLFPVYNKEFAKSDIQNLPFQFFNRIKNPDYIPAWEREKDVP